MIPKQLPILFAAGAEDPVGGFGKGVRKVYEKYKVLNPGHQSKTVCR